MESNGEIRQDVRKLLERITRRKKVSDERINQAMRQFRDCFDYVTEHEVKKSIDGLHHKFIIHAEYEKSRQFKTLVDKFLALSKPEGLTHPSWSILHLLFRLAYRPTDKPTYHFVECQQILEETEPELEQTVEKTFDWGKYLLEGLELPQLPKTDDVWTDSDEEVAGPVGETVHEAAEHCALDRIPLLPKTLQGIASTSTLKQVIQPHYWDRPEETVWTEYQVLHELLWALQSHDGTSLLFEISPLNRIRARPQLSTLSLSSLSLADHVSTYCPMLEGLRRLNVYLVDMMAAKRDTYTLTHQAYAASLQSILIEFSVTLADFERRLTQQKVTTTLKDLLECVGQWKVVIPHLSEVHGQVTDVPTAAENHVKASQVLSVLFTAAQQAQITGHSTLYPLLLRVFLAAIRPFVNILDRWLTEGDIVDPFSEFLVVRNESITPQDEHFWRNALQRKTGYRPMEFLRPIVDDVLLAGRSVELLSRIGHLPELTRPEHSIETQSCHLYDNFIWRFNSFAAQPPSPPHSGAEGAIVEPPPLPPPRPLDFESDDPLLISAFHAIYDSVEQMDPTVEASEAKVATPNQFYPLLPLIQQSLAEPIRAKKAKVCRALLQVLHERCALRLHLETLRAVHLMRAGDLIGRFCLELFRKIDSGDEWRSETCLTLSLINSISSRFPAANSCVSVSFSNCNRETADLNHLQVNYVVPWPVSLVLGKESLAQYNGVFCFLLQIKRALNRLQRLSFKAMKCTVPVCRHRLQLLRAWLLHFVGNLDHYVMECVLERAHLALDKRLDEASDLGGMIDAHSDYMAAVHGQCLQQPSAAFLRDAIGEVLAVSLQVAAAWNGDISPQRLCQLEESYVRHHQYVASVLATDAAHSMLPSVETLAAALIHSCPANDKN